MNADDKKLHEFLRENFQHIYGQKFFDKLFWFYLKSSDPSMFIEFRAIEIYKCLEYFNYSTNEFSQFLRIPEEELFELLKSNSELPSKLSVRLGQVSILLIIGMDYFGSKEDFDRWLNMYKSYTPTSRNYYEREVLVLIKYLLRYELKF